MHSVTDYHHRVYVVCTLHNSAQRAVYTAKQTVHSCNKRLETFCIFHKKTRLSVFIRAIHFERSV